MAELATNFVGSKLVRAVPNHMPASTPKPECGSGYVKGWRVRNKHAPALHMRFMHVASSLHRSPTLGAGWVLKMRVLLFAVAVVVGCLLVWQASQVGMSILLSIALGAVFVLTLCTVAYLTRR